MVKLAMPSTPKLLAAWLSVLFHILLFPLSLSTWRYGTPLLLETLRVTRKDFAQLFPPQYVNE